MSGTNRVGTSVACIALALFFAGTSPARAGGPFLAANAASYNGKTVGSGQCVAFVREASGAPETGKWVRGAKVKGNTGLAKGTAVATLTVDGYANEVTGNHAAIFDGFADNNAGFYVWDQWTGQPVHRRLIRYKGGVGSPSNDGDAFYVIMTK
jgi:hypothetical protein